MSDIAVIFGGPSPEHDVSVLTGLQAAHELQRAGHTVQALYWSKSAEWYAVDAGLEASAFLEGMPKGRKPCAWCWAPLGGSSSPGRGSPSRRPPNSGSPWCAATAGPARTGPPGGTRRCRDPLHRSGVAAAALGMDKLAFGGVMGAAGIATLPRLALTEATDDVGFDGPYIVKPRFGGSSIGIEVVEDLATARALLKGSVHLRAGAVLEPFRPDLFDVQVALRCWPATEVSAIERPLRSAGAGGGRRGEILGYIDKYVGGEGMASAPRELPATCPGRSPSRYAGWPAASRISRSVRGVARIDFLTDGDELLVNEINTIPGSLARTCGSTRSCPSPPC